LKIRSYFIAGYKHFISPFAVCREDGGLRVGKEEEKKWPDVKYSLWSLRAGKR